MNDAQVFGELNKIEQAARAMDFGQSWEEVRPQLSQALHSIKKLLADRRA